MSHTSRSRPTAGLMVSLSLLVTFALFVPNAEAGPWRDLTGRIAPDLVFKETAQGLEPGTRLASFRNKKVVLLAFWLRNCPHCKRELPRVQRMHDLWHRSGLQVVSIVHNRYPLDQVLPIMKQRGWTFPLVRDGDGSMAAKYGGGRRPGFYVIGIDGRVKASNGLSDRIVRTELARWRVHELEREGAMPAALKRARAHVSSGNYGAALRAAEAEGKKASASAAVRAGVARLKTIAEAKLQNRVDRAQAWYAQGTAAGLTRARDEYDAIFLTFKGTSLESKAKALREQFAAKTAGG
ncbi:MAG: TlpA disulfide reductase family protein [Planctomycetota bacterium]|nr:TlpA disulfide reductase family protein [Planctomycetota bacterium]